jgi:hypothetical protein
LLAIVLLAVTALDASADVELEVKPGAPPTIEATVIGAPMVAPGELVLTEPSATPPVAIAATSVRPYKAGTEAMSIALVFNSQEVWVGNDEIELPDSPGRYPGILIPLKAALTSASFADAMPAGSQAVVVAYADKPEIRVPLGPIQNLRGEVLGTQQDYYGKLGSELVRGIDVGIAELRRATTPRKALIVVSDGNDTNAETAKAELARLKKLAAQERIETFAIIYKGALSDPRSDIAAMIPHAITIDNDGFAPALQGIVAHLSDRYYATFPGAALTWDGAAHDLVITVDGRAQDPVTLTLGAASPAATPSAYRWWSLGMLAVLAALLVVVTRRAAG